jgi:hypothetical protein
MPITEKFFEEKLMKENNKDIIKNVYENYPRLKLKKVIFGHNLKDTKKGDSLMEYSLNMIPLKISKDVNLEFSKF